MTGPGNEMTERAADGGRFRASQADRERAIEVLKVAFVEERLSKDELDLRVGRALAARTYAELGAVTSDLHISPTAGRAAAPGPASTPARTLAKAAGRAGVCMLAAFVIVGVVALANAGERSVGLALMAMVAAVIAASGFLGYGVIDAWQEHRSRGQLPSPPGQDSEGRDSKGLESGRPGRDGRDRGQPGAHRDQSLFERCRARPQRGTGPVLGTFSQARRDGPSGRQSGTGPGRGR